MWLQPSLKHLQTKVYIDLYCPHIQANFVTLAYDFDLIRFSQSPGKKETLLEGIPTKTILTTPAVLTDRENYPMAWYLPDLIPMVIQV